MVEDLVNVPDVTACTLVEIHLGNNENESLLFYKVLQCLFHIFFLCLVLCYKVSHIYPKSKLFLQKDSTNLLHNPIADRVGQIEPFRAGLGNLLIINDLRKPGRRNPLITNDLRLLGLT